jgi:predicted Zn-dependent peptidase
MNAGTAEDSTNYFYSFPENRIELWFLLESERFLHPVFREFYKERDVVREERRMRVESSPQGLLLEALLSTSFEAHPYKNMPGGWASDIESFRRPDAEAFYKKYYTPANLTMAIAGDIDPAEAKRLANKYFARLPKGPAPPLLHTVEPPQDGEKRARVASPAQPFLAVAYKRPDQYSKDDAALDVLSDILSDGRTGIFYKELVRDKKIALGAESDATFPGGKYPNLFILFYIPNAGHTVEEGEKEMYAIIDRMKKQKVDDESLKRVKTKLRATLIRKLDNNAGLASELASYSANFGDWRKLFTELDDYEKVTAEDVQRVAQTYLVEKSRTVAYTFVPKEEGAAK